jgi:predicted secreted acid phosphatase
MNTVVLHSHYLEIYHRCCVAMDYIFLRLNGWNHIKNERLAAVFDIDETSLSKLNGMAKFFGYDKKIELPYSYPIPPVLDIYNILKKNNVDIFFVTARQLTKSNYKFTSDNLKKVGYTCYKGLYLRPLEYDIRDIESYKYNTRREIEDMGYSIILNIGDRFTDISNGIAEYKLKLPELGIRDRLHQY